MKTGWKSLEFFVKEVLTLAGFKPQHNIKLQGRQTDIWCTISSPLFTTRVIVECKYTSEGNSLPLDYVTDFCARVALARSSGQADKGWLITEHAITENAWNVLREANLENVVSVLSPDQLLQSLVDFPKYLAQLELSFQKPAMGYIDPHVNINALANRRYPSTGTFRAMISNWVDDAQKPLCLLLGDYGQGKTTCCTQLIRDFQQDRNLLQGRIPLYLRLRDIVNQKCDLRTLFRACLHEQFGLDYYSYELLQFLTTRGFFLFIFDGLDEISFSLRWSVLLESLKSFASIAFPKNKILVTSRPGVFPVQSSLTSTLNYIARQFPQLPNPQFPESAYLVANLNYFNRDQVRQALRNALTVNATEAFDVLARFEDLSDLSKRPITLQMIVESWERIQTGKVHNPASLYETYTEKWLCRDSWRSQLETYAAEISRDLKRDLVESLAWEMFQAELSEVSTDFIEKHVRRVCADLRTLPDLIHEFSREIMICSFLDMQGSRSLTFSHRSFQEYFLARYLARLADDDLISIISEKVFKVEVMSFLANIRDWVRFSSSPGVADTISLYPILAVNILHGLACSDQEIMLSVGLPPNIGMRLTTKKLIDLAINHSDVESLKIESKDMVALRFLASKVVELTIAESPRINLVFEQSRVSLIKIGKAVSLTLEFKDCEVDGGSVQQATKCQVIIQGNVRLNGLLFFLSPEISLTVDSTPIPVQAIRAELTKRGAVVPQPRKMKKTH